METLPVVNGPLLALFEIFIAIIEDSKEFREIRDVFNLVLLSKIAQMRENIGSKSADLQNVHPFVRFSKNIGNNILDSVPPWVDNPCKLVSLCEIMQRCQADSLVMVSEVLARYGNGYIPLPNNHEVESKHKDFLLNFINDVHQDFGSLGLTTSLRGMERLKVTIENPNCIWGNLRHFASALSITLLDELASVLFLSVSGNQSQYYMNPLEGWGEVVASFPSTIVDAEEASKCFALNRYTSTVFHLMRIMEVGLRVLSKSLNDPNLDPKTNPTWGNILSKCRTELNKPLQQRASEWKDDEPFFSGASARLMAVKDAWRNPTMHVEQTYTEETALDVLKPCTAFMRHLSTKLHEN